ncbi:hypothetical protein SLE2022_187250 [Rubroshorea leprosula]
MNALRRGRFVQRTILTRCSSSVHKEKEQKANAEMKKDQKAGAEMKKDQKAGAEMKEDQKAGAEMKEDQKAGAEMKKDQKAGAEVKKVITPVPGEVWVFVQEDRPRKMNEVNIASSTAADSQSMGRVMRKMDQVNIAASTVKNLAQLLGFGFDVNEHGFGKAASELGRSTRPVDKDRDKLFEYAEAIQTRTLEMNEKMLEEFAELKSQLKEIAAAQKRRGSFGPKTGLKRGKGDGSTENGGENGGDANNNGNGSGGDAGSNGRGGGWAGMLKSLSALIFGSGKDDED